MRKQQPLSDTHLKALRNEADHTGEREAAMIALLTRHFIRASELTALKTADVSVRDQTIFISRLKGSVSQTEPIGAPVAARLEAWLKVKPESVYLFPGRAGKMDRKNVYNIFRDLSEKAGCPSVSRSPHATRHSIGQKMAESNVNPRAIQQAAGHRSLNSTAQYFEFRRSYVEAEKNRALEGWE